MAGEKGATRDSWQNLGIIALIKQISQLVVQIKMTGLVVDPCGRYGRQHANIARIGIFPIFLR
jgi:hypothetical protein